MMLLCFEFINSQILPIFKYLIKLFIDFLVDLLVFFYYVDFILLSIFILMYVIEYLNMFVFFKDIDPFLFVNSMINME
jgi:hypothetical protein